MKTIHKFLIVSVLGLFVCGCQERQLDNVARGSRASALDSRQSDTDSGCNCSDAPLSSVEGLINYIAPMPAVWNVRKWSNRYDKNGLIIETAHYRIYTTMMEPLMLKQVPAFVEAAYSAYQSQLPKPVETPDKFVVYLFNTRSQWESFTKSFASQQWQVYLKIRKGAYFLNGVCVAYNIGRSKTFSVIGHECWHQFCNSAFKYRLPSWLDEGIAQLFEVSEYDGQNFVFRQSKNYAKLGALRLTMQKGRMIPLAKLISLNPAQVVMHDESGSGVVAFYAQSYALVRFLREADYGRRLGQYQQMLLGAFNGTWPLSADEARIASDRSIQLTARWNSYIAQKLFATYIGQDITAIEPDYLRFCRKLVYNIRLK